MKYGPERCKTLIWVEIWLSYANSLQHTPVVYLRERHPFQVKACSLLPGLKCSVPNNDCKKNPLLLQAETCKHTQRLTILGTQFFSTVAYLFITFLQPRPSATEFSAEYKISLPPRLGHTTPLQGRSGWPLGKIGSKRFRLWKIDHARYMSSVNCLRCFTLGCRDHWSKNNSGCFVYTPFNMFTCALVG